MALAPDGSMHALKAGQVEQNGGGNPLFGNTMTQALMDLIILQEICHTNR